LIDEEFHEFVEAHDMWVSEPMLNHLKADCLKELADLVYVCYQYAACHDWGLDEAMERVHQSNLSKLGPNGEVLRREDGKILKGPNYQPPNLIDLV
jgi:predicted HAD superfamily Cof-like phosphohydrolase